MAVLTFAPKDPVQGSALKTRKRLQKSPVLSDRADTVKFGLFNFCFSKFMKRELLFYCEDSSAGSYFAVIGVCNDTVILVAAFNSSAV